MSWQSDFYNAVYDKARELGANDVQARLAAAQASEETGFGQSMVGNNAFGIKAGTNYTGPSVAASTEEEYNGNTVREVANFRAYDDFTDSVKDYLSTIQSNFPDAWSAETFSDAVKGLNTGVYGKYATRAAYGSHIKAIDNKYGDLAYADDVGNVPTPYGPNDVVDLAGLPNDVVPVADPNFAPVDHEFAYAANPSNVPAPKSKEQSESLFADDSQTAQPGNWGLNPDVAPVPVPTFNQWEAMANAKPVQAPVKGLFAEPAAPVSSFADPAASGPFGGDFAAPADRFAGPAPAQSQPFDRYVQTTSIPTQVDPNSYQPGTAPMVDVSGVPANGVQSISIQPGQSLAAPQTNNQPISQADVDRALFNVTGDGAFDPSFAASLSASPVAPNTVQSLSIAPGQNAFSPAAAPITQADVNRALFDPATGKMDPSFTEAMMSPGNPVVPSAVETMSVTPGMEAAASRFSTPAKTSRIGEDPAFDAARMPGLVDPQTNVASFADQPADIGGFLEASAAQRGPTSGIFSAEHQMIERMADKALEQAQQERQAAMIAANPAMATPNFNQAMNPTVPSLASTEIDPSNFQMAEITQAAKIPGVLAGARMPAAVTEQAPAVAQTPSLPATPQQQAAGYQQFADTAKSITNLSGTTGIWDDGTSFATAPALETVDVPDQPTITKTQVDIPGPLSTTTDQQQTTQKTTPAATTQQSTTAKRGFWDSIVSPQTAIGAAVGGLATGPIGGFLGAALGQQIAANPGMFANEPMQINNIGSGYEAVTSIWGGGTAPGTQATASDGQVVTSMPGGNVAITNSYGTTTVFDKTGKAMSYFGDSLGQDQDQDTASTNSGGFFGGLFG